MLNNKPLIKVRDLSKQIKGRTVLASISFQVEEGEIFGYLGPNGAGKTTTLRILLGLLRPTSGLVQVMGQKPEHFGRMHRMKMGAVLERRGLYESLTALQNLLFFARAYRLSPQRQTSRIEHLLKTVGLWEERNRKVGTFSNGMKQRLALARALLPAPAILFLDEPTAGLDPEAKVMIRNLILEISKIEHCTVFINSHDLDEVERICSRIAILNRGKILATGPIEDLKAQHATLEQLYLSVIQEERDVE